MIHFLSVLHSHQLQCCVAALDLLDLSVMELILLVEMRTRSDVCNLPLKTTQPTKTELKAFLGGLNYIKKKNRVTPNWLCHKTTKCEIFHRLTCIKSLSFNDPPVFLFITTYLALRRLCPPPPVSATQSDLLRQDVRPSLLPGGLQRRLHADLDGRHRHGNRRAQPLLTAAGRD